MTDLINQPTSMGYTKEVTETCKQLLKLCQAMAEIALISALIPKVVALLDGEVQFYWNIRKDLESIKRELECIKGFLMAADNVEKDIWQNDVWVSQVREAAFEAEDIVDEFYLHFARDQLDAGPSSLSTSRSFCFVLDMRNVGAQRDIAFKMQDIKSKFIDIREGNKRYRTESFKHIFPSADGRCYEPQRDVHSLCNDELVGTTVHEENLINMLIGTNNSAVRNVVSVFGMGGVGKTSLVKKVCDSVAVRMHFKGQVWITVSQTFEPDDILKDLIQCLSEEATHPEPDELGNIHSSQKIQNWRRYELQRKAMALLGKNRYLIIFDDVWSKSSWDSIRCVLPKMVWDSQVVITTRDKATALAACGEFPGKTYELTPLSFDKSLELFYTKIFGSPTECPGHLKEVSKSILKKCGGLPLAIVAIAGVLVSKDVTVQSDEWGRINLSLQEEFESAHRILSLSYNDLPFKLKPCFLYLSIFPEDHLIQKARLIRLWIAEGFVERKDFMTLEEAADSYLEELINRSLIQVVDRSADGRVETCRIHDLLREMIIKKALDQRFAARKYDPRSLRTRRLSLSSDLPMEQKRSQGFCQLRSLLMFDDKQPVKLSMPALFSNEFSFKLLSVLDFQGTILDKFPSTIVKLENLKYLNLSHTDVREVPSSISRLRRLETLNLRSTLVSKLPKGILKLQRLRDLSMYSRLEEVNYGVKAPAGIQGLQSLENLNFLDAGQFNAIAAKDLAPLRRLCVTNLTNKNASAICSTVNDLSYLRVLSISSSDCQRWAMDLWSLKSPSQSLRRLYLTGKLACLPQWLGGLRNLVTIYLKSSKLQEDPAETLGQLPNLIHVELSDAYDGAEMLCRADHFQRIKVLSLRHFTRLKRFILESGTMPNLERLGMDNNKMVKMVPSGIENLSKLKELNFFEMPSELKTEIRGADGRVGSEYDKIKHIREVNWVSKVDNVWKIENLLSTAVGIEEERWNSILESRNFTVPRVLPGQGRKYLTAFPV